MHNPSIASARWMHRRAAYDVAISTAKIDAWEHAGAVAQTCGLNEVVETLRRHNHWPADSFPAVSGQLQGIYRGLTVEVDHVESDACS